MNGHPLNTPRPRDQVAPAKDLAAHREMLHSVLAHPQLMPDEALNHITDYVALNQPKMPFSNISGYVEPEAPVRGAVTSGGSVDIGSGFSASASGTGVYTVTYDEAYDSSPVVVVSPTGTHFAAVVSASSQTQFTVRTYKINPNSDPTQIGVAANSGFMFFAMSTEG